MQANIRGKKTLHPMEKIMPFDDAKELKECMDCKDCLCEDLCKKHEEGHFGKEGD